MKRYEAYPRHGALPRREKNAARAAQDEVDVLTLLSLEQLDELAAQRHDT
jgi:hypothetical protein